MESSAAAAAAAAPAASAASTARGPATDGAASKPAASEPQRGKSGKKICCTCPETRRPRDECVVANGEDACRDLIAAHKACLREEGFNV